MQLTIRKKIRPAKDHIIGNTSIGEYAWDCIKQGELKEENVNLQLKENLWLWLIINVSIEEHEDKNIIRNTLKAEEKIELTHYVNVSPLFLISKDKEHHRIWTKEEGFFEL